MIVLTGATGQLGSQVAAALEGAFPAERLRFGSQDPAKLADAVGRGIDVRRADFDVPETLDSAFAGAEQVVIISTPGSDEERQARHSAAIQAVKRAGVGHVVYTSYAPVAHGLHLIHAQTNANTEAELRGSGLPFTILRNNYYAELLLMFAGIALETGHIRLPAGDGTAAMIGRGDIARAIAATLQPDFERGRTLELTGPQAFGYADLARTIGEATGREVRYEDVDGDDATAFVSRLPVPPQYIPFIVESAREVAGGYFSHVTGDFAELVGEDAAPATAIWRGALSQGAG